MNDKLPIIHLRWQRAVLGTFAVTLTGLMGCTGGPGMAARGKAEDVTRLVNYDDLDTGNIQGPAERNLNALSWKRRQEEIKADPQSQMAQDLLRYEEAVSVFESGDLGRAEKMLKSIVTDRRHTYESFGTRWRRWWGMEGSDAYDPYANFGDPIEEDALFMLGEVQFAQKRFAHAQDSYDDLLNRYPSTRHLDQVTRQMFRIARYWLDFPEDVNAQGEAELRLAAGEEVTGKSVKFEEHSSKFSDIPVIPNLTDRSRPLFDTHGRGLQALRSIWLHDATGPLADDALMLSANHHLRHQNYEDAGRDYKLLRDNYPDSPHFKDAFILGSHVTFASYQGSAYDGQALAEARELKQTALQMFPDLTPEQRQRMQEELDLLSIAEEARMWDRVEFYEAKGTPEAIALYCNLIINKYPQSPFADKARMKLNELADDRAAGRSGSWNPFAQPRRLSPTETGQAIAPAVPPRQEDPGILAMPVPSTESEPAREPASRPGVLQRFGNLLRRTDAPPDLEPVPDADNTVPGRTSL